MTSAVRRCERGGDHSGNPMSYSNRCDHLRLCSQEERDQRMPVVPWRGPPPFGGRGAIMFGATRPPVKPLDDATTVGYNGQSERVSLIERWDSDEVVLEQVPDPSE